MRASRAPSAGAAATALLAVWLAAASARCDAQGLRIQPEIEAGVTLTSNPTFAPRDIAEPDVIFSVQPRVVISSRGGRSTLEGAFGLEAITYLDGSLSGTVRPRGNLGLRTQLVERAVFLNASIAAERTASDVFGARTSGASAFNDYTFMRYRLTPYVERALSPTLNLLARTDHVWTRRVGSDPSGQGTAFNTDQNANEQEQLVRLERRPTPLGFVAEGLRSESELVDSDSAMLSQTAARFIVNYALDAQLIVGLGGGREEVEYGTESRRDTITVVRVSWRPTERSSFDTTFERRFFGKGLQALWRHRASQFAFEIRGDRHPVAQIGTYELGAAGSNVAALLDGILAGRYPNPGERATIVAGLIRDLNLPGTLPGPLELFTSYAQLDESASGAILFLGRVTTASLTGYWRRRTALSGVQNFLPPTSLLADTLQRGASLDATRRLSPIFSVDGQVSYSRIVGLAAREGTSTREILLRMGLTRQLTPTTTATAGARYTWLSSTLYGRTSEVATYAGLIHRF